MLGRDIHFPQILLARELFGNFEILANGVPDVGQGLFFRGALRPAPGESRAGHAVALFGPYQCDWVLHTSEFSTVAAMTGADAPVEPLLFFLTEATEGDGAHGDLTDGHGG